MGLSKKKNLSPLQLQTLGDAHFAGPKEVAAAGLLDNKGIRLGYYKSPEDRGEGWGQVIRYNGDAHLITVAPTGSGKGRDVLVGALLEYEGSCKEGFVTGMLARFASVGGEDRELRSIISTAITQCGFINNKAIGSSLSASDFSFRDLKREATTVYLVLPARFIQPCGKWFRLVLASAIAELWGDEKGKYPILAIIDEFKQLGRLAVIADAMGMARGFGLQLWPILQDLTQLKENYGDQWETFLGGAAVRQFFAPRENFTAEYVSKLCGVKTVISQGQSVQHARELFQADTTGASWGQHAQPLLHPHNVSALGPQESLVLGPQNIVIDASRKPYFATEELAALASPDPYHNAAVPSGQRPLPEIPMQNFADREWSTSQGAKNGPPRKPSPFLRLLTPGSGSRLWFVLTLPVRLPLAVGAGSYSLLVGLMMFARTNPVAAVTVGAAATYLCSAALAAYERAALDRVTLQGTIDENKGIKHGDLWYSIHTKLWAFDAMRDDALGLIQKELGLSKAKVPANVPQATKQLVPPEPQTPAAAVASPKSVVISTQKLSKEELEVLRKEEDRKHFDKVISDAQDRIDKLLEHAHDAPAKKQ